MRTISTITSTIRKGLDKSFNVINAVIMITIFIATAYPFYYILMYSLSNPTLVGSDLLLFPVGLNFDSYKQAFANKLIFNSLMISVARSVIGSLASTFITMLVAYGLSKKDLIGRKAISIFFIITMYFGAGLIPSYLLIQSLHLSGTFWVYVIPGLMSVYNMILMRTYIESLPEALFESAYLDGANDLIIFFKIVIPLCVPVIAAVVLFSAVGHWNAYSDVLIYNSSKPNLYTLQYILMTFVDTVSQSSSDIAALQSMGATSSNVTSMTVRMAVTVISIVPISFVYPFLQKYFIKGIMLGAVKG